jgi:phytoene dehydrogenase-like protein
MLGTGPNNAPISRFIDRKGYKQDKYEEENSRALSYVGRLYNLLIGGRPSDQMYPRGGIQNIIESIIFSFPRRVSLHIDERLVAINVDIYRKNGQSVPLVRGITTDKDEYSCDTLIYSGYSTELPKLVKHELPESYVRNLSSIKRVDSLSIWLGLDKQVFDKQGTEMWVATEDEHLHTWLIPTSNYDLNLAPKNRQLIGFAFVKPENLSSQDMKQRARDTIFSAMPELEKYVDMTHVQELVPEKACWSLNSGFGDVRTPISNLFCVGSDAEKRSMGLTRSSYSVIRMMESLNYVSCE